MLTSMRRNAFTALELLLVVAIIAVIAGFSLPLYRRYQVRNDLNLATEQTIQALHRAQLLSRLGEESSEWGFHVQNGILFLGQSYAARDAARDEEYTIPSTVLTSGLPEVSFSRLEGRPSATGTIILESMFGERRTITITIDASGMLTTSGDRLTICHRSAQTPNTLCIPDSAWPAHQGHGDTLGPCAPEDKGCRSE